MARKIVLTHRDPFRTTKIDRLILHIYKFLSYIIIQKHFFVNSPPQPAEAYCNAADFVIKYNVNITENPTRKKTEKLAQKVSIPV